MTVEVEADDDISEASMEKSLLRRYTIFFYYGVNKKPSIK